MVQLDTAYVDCRISDIWHLRENYTDLIWKWKYFFFKNTCKSDNISFKERSDRDRSCNPTSPPAFCCGSYKFNVLRISMVSCPNRNSLSQPDTKFTGLLSKGLNSLSRLIKLNLVAAASEVWLFGHPDCVLLYKNWEFSCGFSLFSYFNGNSH